MPILLMCCLICAKIFSENFICINRDWNLGTNISYQSVRIYPESASRVRKNVHWTFLPSFRQALTCSKLGNFLFDFRHLDNKKDLKQSFKSYLVQMAGIEPARFIQPQDFKSCASASSATSAFLTGKNDYTTLLY